MTATDPAWLLRYALRSNAAYVALVASKRRAASVIEYLKEQGVSCVEFEDELTRRGLGVPEEPCEDGQIKMVPDYEFHVDYGDTSGHLLSRWLVLGGFTVLFCGLTFIAQKRKDVV